MARWEYCQIRNPASGDDAVLFSHQQSQDLVPEFSAALQKGLKAERSTRQFFHLNLNHTNAVSVAGLLGEYGWEIVNHSVLTGGHEYYTFRRALGE